MNKETQVKVKREFAVQLGNLYCLVITIAMAMGGYILLTQPSVIYRAIAGILLFESARRLVVAHTKRS